MTYFYRLLLQTLLVLTVPTCAILADEPLSDVVEIRSHLEEQLLLLDPISTEFQLTHEPAPESSNPPRLPSSPQNWTWQKSGKKELVSMEPQLVPVPGGEEDEMWMQVRVALNGDVVTRANFAAENGREMVGGARSNHVSEFDRNMTPAHFLGLRLYETEGATLISLLASKQANVLGTETVLGEACVHISVPAVPMREGTGDWEIWLSPSNGYLPRRMSLHSRIMVGSKVIERNDQFEVISFRSLEEGVRGSQFFPWEMAHTHHGGARSVLAITNVKLGSGAVERDLSIQFPDGAEIHEMLDGKPLKVHIVGSKSLRDRRSEIINEAKKMGPPGDVDASPAPSNWLKWLLWPTAVCLLAATVIVWLRRGH